MSDKITFKGGYNFTRVGNQPVSELICLDEPSKVIIPLCQGLGSLLDCSVKIGDKVEAGQIIARNDNNVSSPIHSSINGKVIDIKKINFLNLRVPAVVIQGNQKKGYKKVTGYTSHWDKLSSEEIGEVLYLSGVTSLGRSGIPTNFKSSLIRPQQVEDIIIQAVSSDVYNADPNALLGGEKLYNFSEGIKILHRLIPHAKLHLALDKNKVKIIKKIRKLTVHLDKFKIYSVVPKYPQHYDEIIIPTILNKRFPYGYSAANIGVIVLDIETIIYIFKALVEGNPLLEKIVALGGVGFEENLHLSVKIGTPLEYILNKYLKQGDFRIILNSPLAGPELKDFSLPVTETFSGIIAIEENRNRDFLGFLRPGLRKDSYSKTFISSFMNTKKAIDTNLKGEQRPCIQCGYCIQVCPVRIIPSLLHRYIKQGVDELLMRYNIFNCIDCNLCSYVCPSKIPLAKNIKDAKLKLIEIGCDHSLCILPKFDLKGLKEYKGVKSVK